MKFGDKLTVQISKVDRKGRGCGLVGARETCAYFTAPGETVEGTLRARRQGKLTITTDAILNKSPHRVTPPCPNAGKCGGCAWQHLDYAYQLELKRGLVNDAFEKGGLKPAITRVVPCPVQTGFRNRMDYCVGPRGELGLKEPGRWNAYLDLDTCLLPSSEAVQALSAFRSYVKSAGLEPWDADIRKGYVRYLVIREGKNTGKRMLTVVTSSGTLPDKAGLVKALRPFATTIYHGINPKITDLSVAESLELLHGDAYLEEEIGGQRFLIHPNSFFQTNTLMAGELLGRVREYLSGAKSETLLDLYCGVGFFGISLAGDAERVFGVELDEAAIDLARRNADRNGVKNAEFAAAKAESLIWEEKKPDTVIIDPPRAGLHPKVIASLLRHLPKRIAYVSCNYESFVRDFGALQEAYALDRVEALDLFPHSPHVELATLLTRRP